MVKICRYNLSFPEALLAADAAGSPPEAAEPEPANGDADSTSAGSGDEAGSDADSFDDRTTLALGDESPGPLPTDCLDKTSPVDSEDSKPVPPDSSESEDDDEEVLQPNIPADSKGNTGRGFNLRDVTVDPLPKDLITPPKRSAVEDNCSSIKAKKLKHLGPKDVT